jgi:hypothetical protein
MAKKTEEGKAKGKGKKPSMSDVKEANKAVLEFPADANKTPGIEVSQTENTEAFPIDRVGEDTPPAAAGEDTPATIESAEAGQLGPVLTVTETPVTEETPETPVTETPEVPDPIDENPLNAGVFGSPIIISETVTETPAPVVEETPTPVVAKLSEWAKDALETAETVEETDPTAAIEPAKPTQEELEEKVIERWYNQQNKPFDVNHFELAYSSGINMDRFSNLEAKVGKFKFNRSYVGDKWQITVDETK